MIGGADAQAGRALGVRLGACVATVGLGYAALCIAGRVGSVWPLEWMEGASAQHAQRLLRGLPLYAAARADFIPFVYPPLSYVPMGLGLIASGGALWGARLASVIALCVCCVALWRAGKHVSGTHGAGLLAAGLFAGGYGYTGGFIDLARVDACFCALSLCAVERLCAGRHAQGLLLLALACFAKQHAFLLLAAASGGVLLFVRGQSGVRAVIASWLLLALCVAVLWAWSNGWIWTYCVTVPARHGIEPRLLVSFVLVDLCVYLPLLTALCVCFVATQRDPRARLLGCLFVGAVAASALGRAHPGGDDNVRLPAYALCVLLAAVSCCDLLTTRPRLRWPLCAALMLQLAMLFQSPALYWPSAQTAERFARLHAELERCASSSSDFAAMDHAGLGAHDFVHTLALSDLRMNQDDLAARATDAVLAALRAGAREQAATGAGEQLRETLVGGAGQGFYASERFAARSPSEEAGDESTRPGTRAGTGRNESDGLEAHMRASEHEINGSGMRVHPGEHESDRVTARPDASADGSDGMAVRSGTSADESARPAVRSSGAGRWAARMSVNGGNPRHEAAGTAPRALAISSSFPALMQTLAAHYELCARTPAMRMPTGYGLSETFIYRHKDNSPPP